VNYETAWNELKKSLERGLTGKANFVDKATVLQVQLVMATLEEVTKEDE
jgi:hypothetical protein